MARVCGAVVEASKAEQARCWCGGFFCGRGGSRLTMQFRVAFRTKATAPTLRAFEELLRQPDLFDGTRARELWLARFASASQKCPRCDLRLSPLGQVRKDGRTGSRTRVFRCANGHEHIEILKDRDHARTQKAGAPAVVNASHSRIAARGARRRAAADRRRRRASRRASRRGYRRRRRPGGAAARGERVSTELARVRERVRQDRAAAARPGTEGDTARPTPARFGTGVFLAGTRAFDTVSGQYVEVIDGYRENVVVPASQRDNG
jgi:hypothetical protein